MLPCRTEWQCRHGKSVHGTKENIPVAFRGCLQDCAPRDPPAAARYRRRVPKGKSQTRPVPRFRHLNRGARHKPRHRVLSLPTAGRTTFPPSSSSLPAFIRTVCKSVLFPHKPKIILVLSTRISSLIITQVLCDTKRFSGQFKRGADPWAK